MRKKRLKYQINEIDEQGDLVLRTDRYQGEMTDE